MILGCTAFAHRGLWSPAGPPENSIAAFRAAADAGCGIELDVQLSKDGVPVVFHDPVLDRMTRSSGPVWERTAEELTGLKLTDSDEAIPLLSAALKALPAGTPVLVELKASPGAPDDYIRALDLALFAAPAQAAVMSFVRALNLAAAAHLTGRELGVLIAPAVGNGGPALAERMNAASHDRMTYTALRHEEAEAARAHLGTQARLAAWTVDSIDALERARRAAAAIIFERLDPQQVLADADPMT